MKPHVLRQCVEDRTIKDRVCAVIYLHDILIYSRSQEEHNTHVGPQFTSKFWNALLPRLGSKTSLSSAYHPQTDGPDRTNRPDTGTIPSMLLYIQNDKMTRLTFFPLLNLPVKILSIPPSAPYPSLLTTGSMREQTSLTHLIQR
jgi:hypothetical protein